MEIGEPNRVYTIEPIEDPVPRRAPVEPKKEPVPKPEPRREPAPTP